MVKMPYIFNVSLHNGLYGILQKVMLNFSCIILQKTYRDSVSRHVTAKFFSKTKKKVDITFICTEKLH